MVMFQVLEVELAGAEGGRQKTDSRNRKSVYTYTECVSPFCNWYTILMVSKLAQGDCLTMFAYTASWSFTVILKCLL